MYLERFLAIIILTTSIHFCIGSSFLELSTKLKYGDFCSWENEILRREFASALVQGNSSSLLNLVTQFQIDTITNQRTLCSAKQLFVCSKETETCVCGDPGKAAVLPKLINQGYVIEIEDGKKKCRWAEESACSPPDYNKRLGFKEDDSKCMQGTSCTSKSDGKPCTYVTVLVHTLKNIRLGQKQIVLDMLEGKICACQADEIVIDSDVKQNIDEAEFVSGRLQRVRAKRGVVVDKDAEVAFPSVGAMAPILSVV